VSATGRGHARDALDFYETPTDAIDPLLVKLEERGLGVGGGVVLDPGCGTGAIGARALAHGAARVVGVELDLHRGAQAFTQGLTVVQEDFLAMPRPLERDIAALDATGLFNPPYRTKQYREAARDFICKARLLCPVVGALVRQGFFGSCRSRRDLIENAGLRLTADLPYRPSFCVACTCKLCGGSWRYRAGTPKAECLHPDEGLDTRTGEPCSWRGVPPSGARGAAYKASDKDSADYCWGIWQRGYAGPVERIWLW